MGHAAKRCAIALLWVAHLFIGTVAVAVQDYLPLGLLPALYVIPLAYLGVWLHRALFERISPAIALAMAVAVFVPIKWLQMRGHLYNEVGFAVVADYTRPWALLLNDLESVSGVLMLFQLCRLPLRGVVEAFGRYSIQVYLFHAFIALLVYKAVLHLPVPVAGQLCLSLAATAFLSLAFSRRLAGHPLAQRFIFPRSPADLLGQGGARVAAPALARGLIAPGPSQPDLRR
jgi:hypothetical protein